MRFLGPYTNIGGYPGSRRTERKLLGKMLNLGLKGFKHRDAEGNIYKLTNLNGMPRIKTIPFVPTVDTVSVPAFYLIRNVSNWFAYDDDFVQLNLQVNGTYEIDWTAPFNSLEARNKQIIVHNQELYDFGQNPSNLKPALQKATFTYDADAGSVVMEWGNITDITYSGWFDSASVVHSAFNDSGTFYLVVGYDIIGTGTLFPFHVIKSEDNGSTWTLVNSVISYGTGGTREATQIVKSSSGVMACHIIFSDEIIRSTDGGSSWAAVSMSPSIPADLNIDVGPFGVAGNTFFFTGEDNNEDAVNHGQVVYLDSSLTSPTSAGFSFNEYGDMDYSDGSIYQIGYVGDRAYISGRAVSGAGRGSLGYSTNGTSWTNIGPTSNLTTTLETTGICKGLWSANGVMLAGYPTRTRRLPKDGDPLNDWEDFSSVVGLRYFVYIGTPQES